MKSIYLNIDMLFVIYKNIVNNRIVNLYDIDRSKKLIKLVLIKK
jgi:hypothetical protein